MKQGMASLAQAPPLATSIARIPQIRSRNLQLLKASKLPPPLLTLHHIHIRRPGRQSSVCCKKLSRWKPPLLTDTDGNSFLEKTNISGNRGEDSTTKADGTATNDQALEKVMRLKLPLWVLGPCLLLITGIVPTLLTCC
ncbi:hypothetical protein V6N11_013647 [Hibiscus sabdariffa]|uniref:Uncharacterized protein n=2 Tax=Hibiscus sabdariffa TaxID=183260 RepID=A0ABR2N808_9ROSI